jgi:ubiquinone/menaquinone biosynthesis C-methylase UbiE
MRPPPDWQLPTGVNRGLWEYLHDADLARNYDAGLAGSSLFHVDQEFVARHCPDGARLIDLGCGTGRLLLTFARRGCRVLGVDLSPEMLTVAAGKARAAGLAVGLVRANLTDLRAVADQSFDCAACLFSTLGMVLGADNRRAVVGHAYRLLRPGGRFVLHVHNRWFNFWDPAGRKWLLRDSLGSWFRGGGGDRVMLPHQGVAGLTLHHFTRREAVRLLRGAGFRVVEVRPVSLREDGSLPCAWWFGRLRAYGYLLAAERPVAAR